MNSEEALRGETTYYKDLHVICMQYKHFDLLCI